MGLDFDEAKYASVPSDQVDLTSTMGCAEILRDDTIALILKMEVRFHLAPAGRHKVLWIFSAKTQGSGSPGTAREPGEAEHIPSAELQVAELKCIRRESVRAVIGITGLSSAGRLPWNPRNTKVAKLAENHSQSRVSRRSFRVL